jgi:DNA sulfur modification protein DndD
MTFQFQRIELHNWLVYGDTVNIPLAEPSARKNLIVFYGRNGFGKTSLLKALQFVFHGSLDRDDVYRYWHDAKKQGDHGEMHVTLEFLFDGRVCQLTRMAEFGRWGTSFAATSSVNLIVDGKLQTDQVQDIISQIIPKETQQFVFFDGAEITRYSQRRHEDGVKQAIEQVLGIPAIRNLRDDLAKLVKELEDEQTELLQSNNDHQELINQKQNTEDLLEILSEDKKNVDDRVKGIREALDRLQGEELEIRMIENDVRLLDEKQKRKADYEESLASVSSQIEEQIKQSYLRLLSMPLQRVLQDAEIKQKATQRRMLSQEKKRMIQEILEEGLCVCGRDVDDTAQEVLETLLRKVDAMTISDGHKGDLSASEFNQLASILRSQLDKTPASELIERKASITISIEEIDSDIQQLKEKLRGHEDTTISELYSQKNSYEERLELEQKEQARLQIEIDNTQKKLDDIQRKIDQSTTQTEQGEALQNTLSATRDMYKAVSEYVESLVKLKRQRIEEITSEIFMAITNKPHEYAGIHVKNDYTLQVYRRDSSVVENEKLSAGEKEVLAYSFITALNLSTDIPAPFVMDTPFGHLDAIHRNHLLDSLPRLGVQVLLLATDRDLPHEERTRIEPYILQEFEIERDQNNARSLISEMS